MTNRHVPGPADVSRYTENYKAEVDGVALYEMLGRAEKNPALKELYGRLATTEGRHLALWEEKLREAGATLPRPAPSARVRLLGLLVRVLGTAAVAPLIMRMEQGATGMYDMQPEAIAAGLPADERSHARVFRQLARGSNRDSAASTIARIEGRHRFSSGNALRAAVLGVNDGLVSILVLIMGVAGADPGRSFVFLAGFSALLAGAFSMALGEWISVRSGAEAFARQIAIEREELELIPEEEAEELALIYQSKGLTREQAREAAQRIIANPQTALDTLAREELGMAADDFASAYVAGGTSFALFIVGGVFPWLPWAFLGGTTAIIVSAAAAGFGLFVVGAASSLFTGRNPFFSGGRLLLFGAVCAAITFGLGKLVGVNVG